MHAVVCKETTAMASINVPYSGSTGASVARSDVKLVRHAHEAYELLHVAFVVAPLVAGIDKFFHALTNWDKYLAPRVAAALPVSAHTFMNLVGVIEIIAAIVVLLRPRVGTYVVAAWLVGIIANLIMTRLAPMTMPKNASSRTNTLRPVNGFDSDVSIAEFPVTI